MPVANALAQIDLLAKQPANVTASESKIGPKSGRPIGSEAEIPRKQREEKNQYSEIQKACTHKETLDITNHKTSEEVQVSRSSNKKEIQQPVQLL